MADGNINNIINSSTLTEFETGQWYGVKCAKNLKTYADKTHIPVFIVRCGDTCNRCEDFMKNTLKNSKNYDSISQTKSLFIYARSSSNNISHIQMTKNDTVNIGKYTSDWNYFEDFRTYVDGKGEYIVDYCSPWPAIVGYRNLGDGTILMSEGTIGEGDLVLQKKSRTKFPYSSGTTDINYYLDDFEKIFCKNITPTVKTYSVTFYDYDRTILKEAQQVSANMDAIPPEDPTRENYDFMGWNPDYMNVTQNLSCVAQYRKTDVSNVITKNYCFGLKKDCVLTTGDGVSFQYDYKTNSLYKVNI